jgi:5-methylcytosine-specific restriction endonuclease McrA
MAGRRHTAAVTRARKVCSHGPCPNFQPCPAHERKPWSGSHRSERTISGSRQQQRARQVMLRDDGICHVCGLPGSDEVDHVIALAEDGADDESNLAPIHSKPCHEQKTQAEAERARRRAAA